jgi:DNA topoisomerase VI subunit B
MRKNISQVIEAFKQGKPLRVDSVHTDGKKIYSYNLVIAERDEKCDVWVTDESDSTSKTDTTRINACKQVFHG